MYIISAHFMQDPLHLQQVPFSHVCGACRIPPQSLNVGSNGFKSEVNFKVLTLNILDNFMYCTSPQLLPINFQDFNYWHIGAHIYNQCGKKCGSWPGLRFKFYFMFNSTEQEISTAHKP